MGNSLAAGIASAAPRGSKAGLAKWPSAAKQRLLVNLPWAAGALQQQEGSRAREPIPDAETRQMNNRRLRDTGGFATTLQTTQSPSRRNEWVLEAADVGARLLIDMSEWSGDHLDGAEKRGGVYSSSTTPVRVGDEGKLPPCRVSAGPARSKAHRPVRWGTSTCVQSVSPVTGFSAALVAVNPTAV